MNSLAFPRGRIPYANYFAPNLVGLADMEWLVLHFTHEAHEQAVHATPDESE